MPTYPHIETYYQELEDTIQFGGSDNESSIRAAFQNCLSQYCSNHRENLKLIAELAGPGGIIPDGTVKASLRMARGYCLTNDALQPTKYYHSANTLRFSNEYGHLAPNKGD